MKNMRTSDCLAIANLVNSNLLNKEATIQKAISFFSGITVYLVVHETERCMNSKINFYESRIHSSSIVVIDGNGRVYLFKVPQSLHFDIYYAFDYIEKVRCNDKAEIVLRRESHNNKLLINQSNELFKAAFGKLDSNGKTGRIICERR